MATMMAGFATSPSFPSRAAKVWLWHHSDTKPSLGRKTTSSPLQWETKPFSWCDTKDGHEHSHVRTRADLDITDRKSASWPQGPRAHVVHEPRGSCCFGGHVDPAQTRAEAVLDAWKRRMEVGRAGKRTRKDKSERNEEKTEKTQSETDPRKKKRRQRTDANHERETEEEPIPRTTKEYAEPVIAPQVVALSWSPLGLSNHGGCLLGTCTSDHAARIFQTGRGSERCWQQVEDLTMRLEEALKDESWAPCVKTKIPMYPGESGLRENTEKGADATQTTQKTPIGFGPTQHLKLPQFKIGDRVEVVPCSMEMPSCWLTGIALEQNGGRTLVQFEPSTGKGKKKEKRTEWFFSDHEEVPISVPHTATYAKSLIRPCPPMKKVSFLGIGVVVDVKRNTEWCTGTILEGVEDSKVKVLLHRDRSSVVTTGKSLRCTYLWGEHGWVNVTETLLPGTGFNLGTKEGSLSESSLSGTASLDVRLTSLGFLCSSLVSTCVKILQSVASPEEARSWQDGIQGAVFSKVSNQFVCTFSDVLHAAGVQVESIVDAVWKSLSGKIQPQGGTNNDAVGPCTMSSGQGPLCESGSKSGKREQVPINEINDTSMAYHKIDTSSTKAFKQSCVNSFAERFAYMRGHIPKDELPTYTRGKHLTGPDLVLFNRIKDDFIAEHNDKLCQFNMDEKELTKLAKIAIRQHVIGADALLGTSTKPEPLSRRRCAIGATTRQADKAFLETAGSKGPVPGHGGGFEMDLSTLSQARKSVPAAFVRRFWELRSCIPAESLPQYKPGKHLYGIDAGLTEKVLQEMMQAFGAQLSAIDFQPKEILRLSKVLIRQCIIRGKIENTANIDHLPNTGRDTKYADECNGGPEIVKENQPQKRKSRRNARFGDWARMERWMNEIGGPFLHGADHLLRRNWLSILTMSWSPMQVDKSQNNLTFSLLALGSKAGVITLWRIAEPESFSLESPIPLQRCTLVGYICTFDSWITALEWGVSCLHGTNTLVLSAGSANGSLSVFSGSRLSQIPSTASSLHPLSPATSTFCHPDQLHVLCTSMQVSGTEVKIAVAKVPECIYVYSGQVNQTTSRVEVCHTHIVDSNNTSLITQIKWLPRSKGLFLVASFQNADVKMWEMETWGFSEVGAIENKGLTKEESERRRVLSFETQEADEGLKVLHAPDTGAYGMAFSPCFCFLGVLYAKSVRNLNLQQYERLEKGNVSIFKFWQSESTTNRRVRVFGVQDPREFAQGLVFHLAEELPRPSLWEAKELLMRVGDADLVGELVTELEDRFLQYRESSRHVSLDERPWRFLQIATYLRRLVPQVLPKTNHGANRTLLMDNNTILSQNEEVSVQQHILVQYRTLATDENNRIPLLLMADWVFKHAPSVCAEVMDAARSIYQIYGLEKPTSPADISPRERCPMCDNGMIRMDRFDYGHCPVCCELEDNVEGTGSCEKGEVLLSVPRCMFYFNLCTAPSLWECPSCLRCAQTLPPSVYHEKWTVGDRNVPLCIFCGVRLQALTMGQSILRPTNG
eukprot:scaffold741_cov336-Pavlova_lutheri.AAC.32